MSPRLNLEDQFWIEVLAVATKIGDQDRAIGNVVRFFRYAQDKHKSGKFITQEEFESNGFLPELFPIFAKRTPSGIQAVGAEKHFAWLEQRKAAGKAGGKASSRRARDKIGRLLPKRNQARPDDSQPSSSYSSSYSLSSSSSSSVPDTSDARSEPKTAAVWEAYRNAYSRRYGHEPTRNATVNGQLSNFVKRMGEDAPAVAEFYLTHQKAYYVEQSHAVGPMVKDAEALRNQWKRGVAITRGQATQTERTQNNFNAAKEAADYFRNGGGAS